MITIPAVGDEKKGKTFYFLYLLTFIEMLITSNIPASSDSELLEFNCHLWRKNSFFIL